MDSIELNIAINTALAKSNGETIRQHTDKLLERLKDLIYIYNEDIKAICPIKYKEKLWDISKLVIEYHDYGKLHSPFQRKLLGKDKDLPYELIDVPEIPHNFLSVCFLTDDKFNNLLDESIKKVVFQAIAYHHNREIDERLYQKIIEEVAPKDLKRFQENLNLKFWSYVDPKNYLKPEDNELFKLLVNVKGLLHRLDYTASGNVKVELEKKDFKQIIENTFNKQKISFNSFQSEVKNSNDKNLIVLAPTGGGKTEAGGLYIGDKKGFFVLPLRASINAIYDRFTEKPENGKLKYNYSNVGLLHSTSLFRLMDTLLNPDRQKEDDTNVRFDEILRTEKEARNLSNHITVCTADQLFPFVFKYPGFERIYFTLGYSRIVLDEIQMYNPRMLAFIIKGLQCIKELGGKILIMTATFPEFLKTYFEGFDIKEYSDESVKHSIQIEDREILEDSIIYGIVNKTKDQTKKVLIICNTIKKSIEVYGKLKNTNNVNVKLLHSRFIQRDRNRLEEEIMKFAPNRKQDTNDEAGIWITTQVAEVSLDIDFDVLYTELSTIDSLIQRMGRVNRSGNHKIDPNVIICTQNCSGIEKVYDEEIHNKTLDVLKYLQRKKRNGVFDISEKEKMDLVKEVFSNLEKSDYFEKFDNSLKTIEALWNIGKLYNPIETLREAQEQFREVFNITVIPKPIYERENKDIKDTIKSIKGSTDIEKRYSNLKKLMEYTVSVPFWYVKEKDRFFEDIFIADCYYNDEIGFEPKKINEAKIID